MSDWRTFFAGLTLVFCAVVVDRRPHRVGGLVRWRRIGALRERRVEKERGTCVGALLNHLKGKRPGVVSGRVGQASDAVSYGTSVTYVVRALLLGSCALPALHPSVHLGENQG